jgi:hypothetical protein
MNAVLDRKDLTWHEKLAFLAHSLSMVTDMGINDCPVKQSFENGQYVREIFVPAGTVFIGRPHVRGHYIRGISGSITYRDQNGTLELTAPFDLYTLPGTQCAVVARTDHVARTYHDNPNLYSDFAECEREAFETVESVLKLGREVGQRMITCQA